MTSRWSMKAMMRIAPPHRGHTSGSAAYTFLINSAQRCLKSNEPGGGGISTVPAGDPCWAGSSAFLRFPRLTLLYQP